MDKREITIHDITLPRLRQLVALRYAHLPVRPALIAIFARIMGGNHSHALLLEQALVWTVYNTRLGRDAFYRSNSEWQAELELSLATIKRGIGALRAVYEIAPRKVGYVPVNHYTLDVKRFLQTLADALTWSLDEMTQALLELILIEIEPTQGQIEPSNSSKSTDEQGQIEPGRVEIAPLSTNGSSKSLLSGSQLDQQTPQDARAQAETAGVGVDTGFSPDMKKSLQEEAEPDAAPDLNLPAGVAPAAWAAAVAIAQEKAARGELHTSVRAYALGVAMRQGVAPAAYGWRLPPDKRQARLVADLEEFVQV